MARIVVLVSLVSLALVPATEAAAPSRGESPATGWLDALSSAWDRLFARVSALRAAPGKHGAMIVPNGVTAPVSAPGRRLESTGR